MAVYGHSGKVLESIQNREEKQRLEKLLSGPLPRLSQIVLPMETLATATQLFEQKHPHLLDGMDPEGYNKIILHKRGTGKEAPVAVTVVNLAEAAGVRPEDYLDNNGLDKESWDKIYKELCRQSTQICKDLNSEAMGCRAIPFTHRYTIDSSTSQCPDRKASCAVECIAIANSFPTMEQTENGLPKFEIDHRGKERFLAYMLANKLISINDIASQQDVSYLLRICENHAQVIEKNFGVKTPVHEARHLMNDARRNSHISRSDTELERKLGISRHRKNQKEILLIEADFPSSVIFQEWLRDAMPGISLKFTTANNYRSAFNALNDPAHHFDAVFIDEQISTAAPGISWEPTGTDIVRMLRSGKILSPDSEISINELSDRKADGENVNSLAKYTQIPIYWHSTDNPGTREKKRFAEIDEQAGCPGQTTVNDSVTREAMVESFVTQYLNDKDSHRASQRPITPDGVNANRGAGWNQKQG